MKQLEQSTFALPDFLQVSEEDIHQRMLKSLPRNYDLSEGALIYDVTKPVAMEKAKMIEYELTLTMMMMFPQFAEGIFLDWHGTPIGVTRRPAVPSTVDVTFKGKENTLIPAGTQVSTVGDEKSSGIIFKTLKEAMIDETGVINVRAEAAEPGVIGNVPPESIQSLLRSIPGVQSVINQEAATGGINTESDESFKSRIIDRHRNKPLSGSSKDYIRWAKEVPGVGEVIVLPLWEGPGTVKVLIADSNGDLASPELIASVQQHIAPDEDLGGGLAPIGAKVTVATLKRKVIYLSFSVELQDGYELAEVITNIKHSISQYFNLASKDGLIRYSRIGAMIIESVGVKDYDNLLVNNSSENILLEVGEVGTIGEMEVHEK